MDAKNLPPRLLISLQLLEMGSLFWRFSTWDEAGAGH
jgi:hypothetical protein